MGSSSARLLVVDDNAASRRVIVRALVAYEVVEAETGEAALDILGRESFDVVLLDIGLPGIDGYEVLRRIRSAPSLAAMQVILVTARSQTSEMVKGFEYEADDYIVKPFNTAELGARVKAAVRLANLQAELQRINGDLEREVAERTRQYLDQQQFALLGRNAAQLAHNLNNPLTALLGYLELALGTVQR
jgi:DNA-binding response OmpR family regulator